MIVFDETPFPGVKLFRFDGVTDNRGQKIRVYSASEFSRCGIDFIPKESVIYEMPKADTVFGIHFQAEPKPQQKLIRIISGSGIDYAIDLRRGSATFKKWFCTELSAANKMQMLIPRGFGHLFRSTADNTVMLFQIDQDFDNELSRAISYRDKSIALDICGGSFTVSPRDDEAPELCDAVLG